MTVSINLSSILWRAVFDTVGWCLTVVAVAFFVPSSFTLAGIFGAVEAVGWGVSGSLTVFFEGGVPGVCAVEGESSADLLLGSLVSRSFAGGSLAGGSWACLFL